MAKNSAVNLDITENADGYDIAGGTTERKLTLTGADITLTGSGTNTYTYPSATDTLVGRASTDTLTNKTINTASNTITVTASDVSDFDTEVGNNTDVTANTSARHAESHTVVSHSDTTATGAELNTLTGGGDTTLHDHDGISENTAARHTQNTDTALGSGAVAADHGTAATDQIINVSYGTSETPPTASTTTEGSLYVQYTA